MSNICKKCGYELKDDEMFCSECGQSIEQNEEMEQVEIPKGIKGFLWSFNGKNYIKLDKGAKRKFFIQLMSLVVLVPVVLTVVIVSSIMLNQPSELDVNGYDTSNQSVISNTNDNSLVTQEDKDFVIDTLNNTKTSGGIQGLPLFTIGSMIAEMIKNPQYSFEKDGEVVSITVKGALFIPPDTDSGKQIEVIYSVKGKTGDPTSVKFVSCNFDWDQLKAQYAGYLANY